MADDGEQVAAHLRFVLPVGSTGAPEAEDALPNVGVAAVPGAVVVLRRGWRLRDGAFVRAACVRAGTERWATGVEAIVLDRATAIAREAVSGDLERWEASPAATNASGVIEQGVEGARGGVPASAKHLLGFAEGGRTAVLCTVTCVGPETTCRGLVGAARFEGAIAPPPTPAWWVRGLFTGVEHPLQAALVMAGVLALLAALVLRFRPTPAVRRG